MKLTNEELVNINGGSITINSAFLNGLARIITVILDFGRTIGSSWYRYKNKNYCA